MNLISLLSYFFALVSVLVVVIGYMIFGYNLGYPDGYVTDYRQAGKEMYEVLVFPSVAVTIYFIYLARSASESRRLIKLFVSVSLLLAIVVTAGVLDLYFFTNLDHGQGG